MEEREREREREREGRCVRERVKGKGHIEISGCIFEERVIKQRT